MHHKGSDDPAARAVNDWFRCVGNAINYSPWELGAWDFGDSCDSEATGDPAIRGVLWDDRFEMDGPILVD